MNWARRFLTLAAWAMPFICASAQANLLLEPYVGYEIGSYRMNNSAFENGNIHGTDFGGRLGMTIFDLLFVAFDAKYAHHTDSPTNPNTTFDGDGTERALGITAGIDFPLLLRAWVGYNFVDNIDYSVTSTHQYNSFTLKGSSTKFGIGFSPLPLFSLNVEYIIYNQTKVVWSGGTLDGKVEDSSATSIGDISRDYSAMLFSVSVPFTSSWL